MSMRSMAAVAAGRLGGRLSRVLRVGGGTSLPGAIALKIDPRIIAELAGRIDRGSAVVTATNGKTTTANMLAQIYRTAGLNPVHNAAGANLDFGVATALMAGAGRVPGAATIGLFEVDEATLRNVVADIDPTILSVGNIFRDQLDRFGEVDQTARLIGEGIARLAPTANLILNADDPRVAALGRGAVQTTRFFGLDAKTSLGTDPDDAQDSKDCLVCGEPLSYDRRFFSHLGSFTCPGCGFSRPEPSVFASNIKLSLRDSQFRLVTPTGEANVTLAIPAIYNVYNALAATAMAQAAGIRFEQIVMGLESFRPAFGRFESIDVDGRRMHLMLIKNPTGFNQAIEALNIDPSPKNVMIAINDNLADGTDVSWLWDVDVERLGRTDLMLASGVRAHDMALRLKYAGFAKESMVVEPNFDAALKRVLESTEPGDNIYILPTYTALLDIRKRLEKLGGVPAFWQASPEQPRREPEEMTK